MCPAAAQPGIPSDKIPGSTGASKDNCQISTILTGYLVLVMLVKAAMPVYILYGPRADLANTNH